MTARASFHDRYGLPLTTNSQTAVDRYTEAIDAMLSGNLGAHAVLTAALEADEGFALAHAALTLVHKGSGRREAAKASLARARALSGGISRRERQHVEAVGALVSAGGYRALDVLRSHLAEFPREALLFSHAWQLISFVGAKDRRLQYHAMCRRYQRDYGDDWWFLGSYGFILHELDRFEESRRASERSLRMYPRNAIASHSLAHIFYETSEHRDGLDFLGNWIAGYDRRAPLHCHFSWHLALFELMSGHYQRALALFDKGVRGRGGAGTALPDAASLLWRCQIYGYAEAPFPWKEVTALAGRSVGRRGAAFADTHTALAYAGAGDLTGLDALAGELRVLAGKGHVLAKVVGVSLVEGIRAFALGDYHEAIRLIAPTAPELVRMGGSHAQLEVFEETLLVAYLRAGRYEEAEALLRTRLGRRETARDFFWLGRAQAALGDAEGAAASTRRGRERWPDADANAPELAARGSAPGMESVVHRIQGLA